MVFFKNVAVLAPRLPKPERTLNDLISTFTQVVQFMNRNAPRSLAPYFVVIQQAVEHIQRDISVLSDIKKLSRSKDSIAYREGIIRGILEPALLSIENAISKNQPLKKSQFFIIPELSRLFYSSRQAMGNPSEWVGKLMTTFNSLPNEPIKFEKETLSELRYLLGLEPLEKSKALPGIKPDLHSNLAERKRKPDDSSDVPGSAITEGKAAFDLLSRHNSVGVKSAFKKYTSSK